jgi:AcrR family transcriptional regulator
MSNAHRRKKQPALVRQQLLDVAAELVNEEGVNAVTLDAVAGASGVSKGGLLHHFPTKAALLDALFDDLLERFDMDIDRHMRLDPSSQGRFTRAYLLAAAGIRDDRNEARHWTQATIAMLAEPRLRQRWHDWLEERMEAYVGTDSRLEAQIVRFAADGLWLSDATESQDIPDEQRAALLSRLIELTRV